MYNDITNETPINKGDWVRDKKTGEELQVGELIDGKYHLKIKGKTDPGIYGVASLDTLIRRYEKLVS